MRRSAALGLVALFAAGLLAAGELPAGELPGTWRHWSRFRVVELEPPGEAAAAGLIRVPIPHELFGGARTDLADVRLIDAEGAEIGFVVDAAGEPRRTEWRGTTARDQGFVPGEYSQVVLDTGERGALHDAVRLSPPTGTGEFFVWVEIAASDDGETWRIVQRRAPLYRFRERPVEQGWTLRYARTRDRWLRLRFLEPDREISVPVARVGERFEATAELEPIPGRLVSDPASPAGESWYRPTGELTRLPITGLRVRTDRDAFHRPVDVWVSDDGKSWRRVGSGQIYRYGPFAGEPFASESIDAAENLADLEVIVPESAAPWWRVVVIDRDDPPIEDLEVELLVRRRQIVFRPTGSSPYRLIYGNSRAEPPDYELAHLASRETLAEARPARLGPEQRNDTWRSAEPFTERHPILLWLALGLVILALATMALKTLRG